MSEYIEVGQPLQFTDPNTPTRVGEIVENVSDIYNIPSPRLGMQVFVKSEKKSFVITSLKSKVISGVDVPEAAVEAFEPVGAKSITWNNDTNPSNMNDFVVAGVYDIKGERTRTNDNLPILNRGGGHSFNARLTVLDSSITGSGKDDDKCITQVLSFSNRLGQGEVYIRTGKGSSLDNLTWEKWSTLQRNVNVEEVTSLDHLVDNGIYSGVYQYGSGVYDYETFVLVVINDYAIAGDNKKISQFKYAVALDGTVSYKSRLYSIKPGEEKARWDINWLDINEGNINKAIKNAIDEIVDNAPETFDTLKEIANWVNTHEDLYTTLKSIVEQNSSKLNEIESLAVNGSNMSISCKDNLVDMDYTTIDGGIGFVRIPSATTTTAGVMSAKDKTALDNIPNLISEKISKVIGNAPETFDTLKEVADWIENDKTGAAAMANAISANNAAITAERTRAIGQESLLNNAIAEEKTRAEQAEQSIVENTDKKIATEIDKLKDGDTLVGQAREIHSRNGKTVSDSFLARTTAGSGTIGDGVASLKSVGGNIVKNLVDGTKYTAWLKASVAKNNNIYTITRTAEGNCGLISRAIDIVESHIYYACFLFRGDVGDYRINVTDTGKSVSITTDSWTFVSVVIAGYKTGSTNLIYTQDNNIKQFQVIPCGVINLTELYGETKANSTTKTKYDKLFGTMDALPQGLTIANPATFTSTGFNQFNPENVLEGKAIVDNAFVPGDKKIAVIPCLPCKVGVGENNGYCIHGDFGEDINVYLTPLNPMEVEGELYMHKLTKYATTDTYVPLIKGYLLVEVPTTANLCAHFLWSEDKCKRDTYEPYFESKVELPTIPQMSEWGLAGMYINNVLVQDVIDLENNRYIKRIGKNAEGFFPLEVQEEYPLPKVDNNYISSDYGVEQFDSVVPCNANNLYYMRSLAGETRNFLDRLMAGLGTSDATVVADRILAVVNPAVPANVEPETPIEE